MVQNTEVSRETMVEKIEEITKDKNYAFPWGFNLGNLRNENESIPLYTGTNDGGFCLLYDKASEPKADDLLESLCLELLSTMPHGSLKVDMLDFGKKKFYSLSPLQNVELFEVAFTSQTILSLFERLENTIISRHNELLCCNRPSISDHNQMSKLKQTYHLVLMNLKNFPTEEIEERRIQNFVESASHAGVYVIAFGYHEIEQSENKNVQIILNYFKTLRAAEGMFEIDKEIFEFTELLEDHTFEALSLDKGLLLQTIFSNADLESMMDPENIKLETDTKV
ncbi:MAG: hypothetical protein L3J43_02740 [Sulfurovum sp.]|nr:hypothetical protein [Sulfurovum sp.]